MSQTRKNLKDNIKWGQKIFSQPLIVQVILLRKMREVSNFHHRYSILYFNYERQNGRKKNPGNHIVGFKKYIFID